MAIARPPKLPDPAAMLPEQDDDGDVDELIVEDLPVVFEDPDELLDVAAQGQAASEAGSEIDAMGAAAGLVDRDDRPFHGIAEVERRDDRRWELDPASADESQTPEPR